MWGITSQPTFKHALISINLLSVEVRHSVAPHERTRVSRIPAICVRLSREAFAPDGLQKLEQEQDKDAGSKRHRQIIPV
jgi:hypothetical protein